MKWDKHIDKEKCTVTLYDNDRNSITVPFKETPPNINIRFQIGDKFIEVPISSGWLYRTYVLGENTSSTKD